jgi:hypothetical protein
MERALNQRCEPQARRAHNLGSKLQSGEIGRKLSSQTVHMFNGYLRRCQETHQLHPTSQLGKLSDGRCVHGHDYCFKPSKLLFVLGVGDFLFLLSFDNTYLWMSVMILQYRCSVLLHPFFRSVPKYLCWKFTKATQGILKSIGY